MTSLARGFRARRRVGSLRLRRRLSAWLICLAVGHHRALCGVPGDFDVQCVRCGRLLSP